MIKRRTPFSMADRSPSRIHGTASVRVVVVVSRHVRLESRRLAFKTMPRSSVEQLRPDRCDVQTIVRKSGPGFAGIMMPPSKIATFNGSLVDVFDESGTKQRRGCEHVPAKELVSWQ
jgi:hypothetical protein